MVLSAEFIEKQKESLLKEKERLVSEVKKLDQYPDYGEQEDDNILELQDYENNEAVDDNLKNLLKKVEAALLAIENGTYGKCAICNGNIELGRIEIMPWIDMCVTCSEEK